MAGPVTAGVNLIVSGGGAFTAAMNNATANMNKFGQAAAQSANMAQIQQEKLAARYDATQARLASLQDSLARNSQAFAQNAALIANSQAQLSNLNAKYGSVDAVLAKLESQQERLDAEQAKGDNASNQRIAGLERQIEKNSEIVETYNRLESTIEKASAAQNREGETIRYVTAQVAVKTARVRELDAQMGTLATNPAPKTFFQSFQDYLKASFSSIDSFINEVDRISKIVDRLSTSSGRVMRQVNQVWQAVFGKPLFDPVRASAEKAAPALDKTNAQFQQLVEKAGPLGPVLSKIPAPMQDISVAAIAAGNAIGQFFVQAVNAAFDALRNFGTQAFEAVSKYELLSHSIQFMAANELKDANSTLTMDQAMSQAAGTASNLLQWIQQLGIRSPFSAAQIQSSFQLAMGFGFTSEQATRLIRDEVDLASATGRGEEIMNRLTLAFGQISSTGKLAGRQLRELAYAGFPVDAAFDTMAKMLGVTRDKFNDMEQNGAIPANIALEGLAKTMEDRAGGAAEKMSGTLSGLMESLKDIGTVTLRNLFGHLNTDTLQVEGALGALQKRLFSLVELLQTQTLQTIATQVGKAFGDLTEGAFTWGENFITQFANGIIAGVGALVDALSNIAGIVAYWLAPGSPPRLLPDLDKWGLGAMLAYMHGWSDVQGTDFSVIGDAIEGFLRSLPATVMPEIDLVPTVAKMRASLTGLLSGGGSMSNFLGSMGNAGIQVEGFVTAMLSLDKANKAVADSQKKVDDITSMYDEKLSGLNAQLKAVQNAQQDMSDDKQIKKLTRIANDTGASEGRRHAASLQLEEILLQRKIRGTETERDAKLKAANAELENEKKKQALAQASFNNQKLMLDAIIKQNQLWNEQIKLLERLAKEDKAKGGGGAASEPKIKGPEFAGIMPDVKKITSAMEGVLLQLWITIQVWGVKLQAAWNKVWGPVNDALIPVRGALAGVQSAWETLGKAFLSTTPGIQAVIAMLIVALLKFGAFILPLILKNVQDFLLQLADFWSKNGVLIVAIVTAIFMAIVAIIGVALFFITGAIALAMTLINTDWTARWNQFRWFAFGVFEQIKANTYTFAEGVKTNIRNKIGEAISWLKTNLPLIKDHFEAALKAAKAAVVEKMDEVRDYIQDRVKEAFTWLGTQVQKWHDAGSDLINGIKQGVIDAALGLASAVIAAIAGAIEAARHFIDSKSPSKKTKDEIGKPFMQGIQAGMEAAFPSVQASLGIMMGTMVHPSASPAQMGNMSVSNSNVNNYNYSPHYGSSPHNPSRDFGLMKVLAR